MEPSLFEAVQEELKRRARRLSDEEMLALLSKLRLKVGWLTAGIIDAQEGMPSSNGYKQRFGSLYQAYELAGFTPRIDSRLVAITHLIQCLRARFTEQVMTLIGKASGAVVRDTVSSQLKVNAELTVFIAVARCHKKYGKNPQWRITTKAIPVPTRRWPCGWTTRCLE